MFDIQQIEQHALRGISLMGLLRNFGGLIEKLHIPIFLPMLSLDTTRW
jgi:hypothetical protein